MELPNCWTSARSLASSLAVVLSVVSLLHCAHISQANPQDHLHFHQRQNSNTNQEPIATNEIPTNALTKATTAAASAASAAYPSGEPTGASRNFSQFSREVTNLRLTPDLRSIKLRWTYEHSDANRPEWFRIRFCELTSWMSEIKCRHKEVPVGQAVQSTPRVEATRKPQQLKQHPANDSNSAVITQTTTTTTMAGSLQRPTGHNNSDLFSPAVRVLVDGATELPPPSSASLGNNSRSTQTTFETQIYDLRALTNYTFHVQVARFLGEPAPIAFANTSAMPSPSANAQQHNPRQQQQPRQRPSRRLDLAASRGPNELVASSGAAANDNVAIMETTKPFSAEAVKCLADSSEVLVNTGRYFGGRISVEGSPDGRCQLVGNRSSEQPVYSFHIDHQLCHSKIMDGNRIETMILVHENKDILTHNTARFLVQCNIGQKSFTVKASISLPKVMNSLSASATAAAANGGGQAAPVAQQTRPALITPLSGRPRSAAAAAAATSFASAASGEESFDRVQLGSMPGIYRLIRAESSLASAASVAVTSSSPATSNYLAQAETSTAATQTGQPASAGQESVSTATTTSATMSSEPARQQSIIAGQTSAAAAAPLVAQSLLAAPEAVMGGRPQQAARQSKGLGEVSLPLSSLPLPKPVDVSSRILFVERARAADGAITAPVSQREARLMAGAASGQRAAAAAAAVSAVRKQQSVSHQQLQREAAINQAPTTTTAASDNLGKLTLLDGAVSGGGSGRDGADWSGGGGAVIMTNNHRVAGDFPSLERHRPAAAATGAPGSLQKKRSNEADRRGSSAPALEEDFSIKYSPNRVDDYALSRVAPDEESPQVAGRHSVAVAPPPSANQMARSRSGRMRHIGPSTTTTTTTSTTPASPAISRQIVGELAARQANSASNLESRMGDVMQAAPSEPPARVVAAPEISERPPADQDEIKLNAAGPPDAGTPQAQPPGAPAIQHTTLAHNITGALIRWSLKTLGNLARKSLESLVVDEAARQQPQTNPHKLAGSSGLGQHQGDDDDGETTMSLRHSSDVEQSGAVSESPGSNGRSTNERTLHEPPSTQHDGFFVHPTAARTTTTRRPITTTTTPTTTTTTGIARSQRPANAQPPRAAQSQARDEQLRQARRSQSFDSTTVATQHAAPPPTPPQPLSTHNSQPDHQGGKPNARGKHPDNQASHDSNDELLVHTSDRYSKREPSSRSLWPIYSLWAICGLIALIMAAIYFVLMSPKRTAFPHTISASSAAAAAAYRQANNPKPVSRSGADLLGRLNGAFERAQSPSPPCATSRSPSGGGGGGDSASNSVSCDNSTSEILSAINKPKLFYTTQATVAGAVSSSSTSSPNSPSSQQPKAAAKYGACKNQKSAPNGPASPFGSATTRSTSAASSTTWSGRENYCKNQEQYVVFADHLVLTDDNSSLGDADDQWLTGSGRQRPRRRPPSESFA